jgi:hypothetical protein
MNLSDTPFAEKKFMTVNGQRMAYIHEGQGDAIVFSHGNPPFDQPGSVDSKQLGGLNGRLPVSLRLNRRSRTGH